MYTNVHHTTSTVCAGSPGRVTPYGRAYATLVHKKEEIGSEKEAGLGWLERGEMEHVVLLAILGWMRGGSW